VSAEGSKATAQLCCRSASRQLHKEIAPRPRNFSSTLRTDASAPLGTPPLGAWERPDVASVGFLRGVADGAASRGPGPHSAFVAKGPGPQM